MSTLDPGPSSVYPPISKKSIAPTNDVQSIYKFIYTSIANINCVVSKIKKRGGVKFPNAILPKPQHPETLNYQIKFSTSKSGP